MNDLLRLVRAHHWVKNLLVFVGVFFSGRLFTETFLEALLVFASFCLASAATYILNDLHDIQTDRLSPQKTWRPLASGRITKRTARCVLAHLSLALLASLAFISRTAALIILAYMAVSSLYTYRLKEIFLLDLAALASGYILRVLAGTTGLGVKPSGWLLVTVFFLSLCLASAKRWHEKNALPHAGRRPVLKRYAAGTLASLMSASAALATFSYSAYVFTKRPRVLAVCTIPFAIAGMLRYVSLCQGGRGVGDVPDDALKDRPVLCALAAWALLMFLDMYM